MDKLQSGGPLGLYADFCFGFDPLARVIREPQVADSHQLQQISHINNILVLMHIAVGVSSEQMSIKTILLAFQH